MIINRDPIPQFSEEHHYTPAKSGMIDCTTWAVYTTDPKTGEKLLVWWQVRRPRDLITFVKECLEIIEKSYKHHDRVTRYTTMCPEYNESVMLEEKKTIAAIKCRLSEIDGII